MSRLVISRRSMLGGLAVLGCGSVTGVALEARRRSAMPQGRIVLLDRHYSAQLRKQLSRTLGVNGEKGTFVELQREVVRHWRDALAPAFAERGRLELVGQWDKVILFRGLAREAGGRLSMRALKPGLYYAIIEKVV